MRSSARIPYRGLNTLWLFAVCTITVTLLSGSFVTTAFGAPAKLDGIAPPPQSPFPLEAQPAVFTDAVAAALNSDNGGGDGGFIKSQPSAVDSYGNPIEALKPIDTPDGRKVISAQGLQFEIPNYASGITEIKKPADDLLPPFIGEFNNNTSTKNKNFIAPNNTTNLNTNNQQNKSGELEYSQQEQAEDVEVNEDRVINFISNDDYVLDVLKNRHKIAEVTDVDNNSKPSNEAEHIESKLFDPIRYQQVQNEIGESHLVYFKNESVHTYNNKNTRKWNFIDNGSDLIDTDAYKNIKSLKTDNSKQIEHWNNKDRTLAGTSTINSTTNTFKANTVDTTNTTTSAPTLLAASPPPSHTQSYFNQLAKFNFIKHHLLDLTDKLTSDLEYSSISPLTTSSVLLKAQIAQTNFKSSHYPPFESEHQAFISNNTNKNFIQRVKRSPTTIPHSKAPSPLSNGNFNYPNVPTDLAIINRIAAKYQTPLPTLDPIAVGVPSDSIDGTTGTGSFPEAAATVDVENAQLVELKSEQSSPISPKQTDHERNSALNSLPSYILELNDPDIGGPVEYVPADDASSLKVIAWDLLPPLEQESKISTSLTAAQSLNSQGGLNAVSSKESVSIVPLADSKRSGVYFTSSTTTTPRSTTVRTTRPTTRTTTTTQRPTTTTHRTTTTTHRPTTTTTRRATTTFRTTTTTTTPAPLNPNDFFQLEGGDSYTIPSWLADIDDPELDAAVTFITPENIQEYNDTISRDILPPLEPYTDLNNIDLPEPAGQFTTTSTTIRPRTTVTTSSTRQAFTTTTRRPTVSTPRPHWVRAYPTTARTTSTTTTQRPNTLDDRFSSNHIAQSHDSILASSTTFPSSKVSTSFLSKSATSTTTTTQRPRLTTPAHQQHNDFNRFNQNLPTTNTDHVTNTEVENSQVAGKSKFSNSNPFLPARSNDAPPFGSLNTNKFSTTTTTTTSTTTTTPATPIEENPFDSATIPSWLADFDYPDLAPGVPFIYNTGDSKSEVSNDLLPPSQQNILATDATKPVFITSSPPSFNSFQISPSLANRHDSISASASTSTTRTFAFNNFPSKVTTTVKPSSIHNPFARVPNNKNNNQEETAALPPVLFIPPTAETESNVNAAAVNEVNNENPQTNNLNANNYSQQQQTQLQPAATAGQAFTQKPSSSSFNTNFPAPFESTTAPGSADAASSGEQELGSSTKTTFTKSNEGKVITNNIFGFTSGATAPSKQFGFSTSTTAGQTTLQKDFQQNTSDRFSSSSSSFSGSSQTFNKAATPSGFSTFTSTQQSTNFGGFNSNGAIVPATSVGVGKYTGGFGGAPGVLGSGKVGYAVQADGSTRPSSSGAFGQATVGLPTTAPKLPTNPNFANRIGIATPAGVTPDTNVGVNKYQGTFGGPPGVLVPFDIAKSG